MIRFVSLITLLACTGESVIEKQQNIAPVITIVSHSDGSELQEGYIESFRAQTSDEDDSFADLQVAWYVGDEIVCDWTTPSPAGDTFCDVVFTPEDTSLVATVRDPEGAGAMSEIAVVVNPTEAPVVSILTPTPGQQNYSSDLIQFSALVQDLEDEPEDLTIEWRSNIDGPLVLNTTPDSAGEISDYGYLSEGQHAIELSVTDTSGKTSIEEVVLRVGGENHIPECSILSPDDQQTVLLGETVLFTGTATDADVSSTDLQVQWISDQDGVLGTGSMNSAGNLSFSYAGFSANTHVITLQVTDEVGAICQDTRFLHVGEPPTATIDSPTNGEIFAIGDLVVFQGAVSDNEDAVNTLQTTWTSSIDGTLFSGTANSTGTSQFPSSTLSAGVHSVTFSVLDSNGLVAEDLITFRVNTPPTQPTVVLSPDPTYSNTALSANASGSIDADGQNVTYTYEWYENSVLTTFASSLIPASELDVGEIWTVRVTPNDGFGQGNFTEVSTTIENSTPTITTPVISPSTNVYNDTVLTCSATASDVDETVTPTYTWSVNGYTLSGSSLDLSTIATSVGDVVTCTANVTDSNGGTDNASNSVTIFNRQPSINSISISPSSPTTNDVLSCSSSTSDLDGDTVSVTTEWQLNGTVLGSQNTLQLDASMISPQDTVDCVVTATDGQGSPITSVQSVTILNTNPTIDSTAFTPNPVYISDTVTCAVSASDIDGDVSGQLTIEIQDGQGGILSSSTGQSSLSLDLSTTSLSSGDTVSCYTVVQDGYGGTDSSTASLTILNSAPQFDSAASITSDTGDTRTNSVLTCLASASDPNQGTVNMTYQWLVAGSVVGTSNTFTVTSNQSNVGDAIECIVTATDSDGEFDTSSASTTVLNTVPTISSINIQATAGLYNDSMVECIANVVDPDEALTPSLIWQVAGSVVGTGISLDLATTAAIPNDTLTCIANITDGNGGTDNTQVSETLLNRTPTAPSVSISPTAPEEGVDSLTCSIDVPSQDQDGQSISYVYQWTNTGTVTGYTSDVVPANALTGGEVWTCSVTATDGLDTSTASTDNVTVETPVTIGEDPTTPGVDCQDILDQNPAATDGTYWISPNGSTPFLAYCLMSINNGGWTVQSYIRSSGQWNTSLTANSGTIGDISNGFASGGDLSSSGFSVTEKMVVYLKLIEGGNDLGTQWMTNYRSSAVSYSALTSNQSGWSFEDSFGGSSGNAGNVCSHGCSTYRGYGMFHDGSGIGYHGTQTGDYGCRDGNNICWNPRGGGCNVGSYRCSYLTGTGEGVIYAVK